MSVNVPPIIVGEIIGEARPATVGVAAAAPRFGELLSTLIYLIFSTNVGLIAFSIALVASTLGIVEHHAVWVTICM